MMINQRRDVIRKQRTNLTNFLVENIKFLRYSLFKEWNPEKSICIQDLSFSDVWNGIFINVVAYEYLACTASLPDKKKNVTDLIFIIKKYVDPFEYAYVIWVDG